MEYTLRPELLGDIFAVPAPRWWMSISDWRVPPSSKVLLWALRAGKGCFDADQCAAAIGLSAPDCADAMQYWFQNRGAGPRGGSLPGNRAPLNNRPFPAAPAAPRAPAPRLLPRPRPGPGRSSPR